MEEKHGLRIIKLSDGNFLRTLESSIRVSDALSHPNFALPIPIPSPPPLLNSLTVPHCQVRR